MTKREKPPILDAENLLIQVHELLEGGNSKEALEITESGFLEVATKNPAEYFRLLRDAAYDRPSAWWSYCAILKLPKRLRNLELSMHAESEPKDVRKKVKAHFNTYVTKARGNEAFKILFSWEWDT
jgi:hypothetical protein